jgi:nucleoside-diphosphate-sugar epimerase
MYCIAGELLTASEISDIVKRTIPDAKIFFKPDPEKTRIVRSWAQKIDESAAIKDWSWKRKFNAEHAIIDFIQEIKSNPEIYN